MGEVVNDKKSKTSAQFNGTTIRNSFVPSRLTLKRLQHCDLCFGIDVTCANKVKTLVEGHEAAKDADKVDIPVNDVGGPDAIVSKSSDLPCQQEGCSKNDQPGCQTCDAPEVKEQGCQISEAVKGLQSPDAVNINGSEIPSENDDVEAVFSADLTEGVSVCGKCREVKLCSNCSQRHRRNNRCDSWKIVRRKTEGRCLSAARAIKPLEVVFADTSVIVLPNLNKLGCLGCGRSVNYLYLCPDCNLPLCGTSCPLQERHVVECKLLAGKISSSTWVKTEKNAPNKADQEVGVTNGDISAVNGAASDSYAEVETSSLAAIYNAIAILRLIDLKANQPQSWALIRAQETHEENIRQDAKAMNIVDETMSILNKIGQYTKSEVIRFYGLIKINGYPVSEVSGGSSLAMFPLRALLTHSCLPNLQYIEKEGGSKIVLQAVTNIKPGDLLTVRYVSCLQGRISIGKRLKEQWYFQCSCARCVDGTELGTFTSSAFCETSPCSEKRGILLVVDPTNLNSDWICPTCQTIRSSQYVEDIEERYVTKLHSLSQGDFSEYYNFLNQLGDRFHASHHLVMRMAHFIVRLQGNMLDSLTRERIETQVMLCDKLINYVTRLDPGASQTRAKLILEKNKADLNLAKFDCEQGKITRKMFMAKIKEGVRTEVNAKKILYYKWDD